MSFPYQMWYSLFRGARFLYRDKEERKFHISLHFHLFYPVLNTQVRFYISKIWMRSSIVRFNKSCIYSVWHAGNVHYGFQFEIPIYEWRMDERSESEKRVSIKKKAGKEKEKIMEERNGRKKCQFDSNLCT